MIETRTLLKRSRWVVVPALVLLLATTLLPSLANAHTSEFHATGVAEGESTLFGFDPPGIEPAQEFWLDSVVGVKHKVGTDGKNYYAGTFKVNSLKGLFTDDDSIWAPPGDYQPASLQVRLMLYWYDHNTGVLNQLHPPRGWITPAGYAYGCWGDGDWVHVPPNIMTSVVARIWVNADRRYWDGFRWTASPLWQRKWHGTSSHRLGSVVLNSDPNSHWSTTHIWEPDPLTHHWVQFEPPPGSTHRGDCPNFTPAPQ